MLIRSLVSAIVDSISANSLMMMETSLSQFLDVLHQIAITMMNSGKHFATKVVKLYFIRNMSIPYSIAITFIRQSIFQRAKLSFHYRVSSIS